MAQSPTGSRTRGVDFLEINRLLTEDEQLVRDSVRVSVNDKVLPIIGKCF